MLELFRSVSSLPLLLDFLLFRRQPEITAIVHWPMTAPPLARAFSEPPRSPSPLFPFLRPVTTLCNSLLLYLTTQTDHQINHCYCIVILTTLMSSTEWPFLSISSTGRFISYFRWHVARLFTSSERPPFFVIP